MLTVDQRNKMGVSNADMEFGDLRIIGLSTLR
jgi:hypothetical protein